ncbi:MAG: site-specific integrase [Clostridia bacterium]|nr:site-specific integrase [Clostridia bacterium]
MATIEKRGNSYRITVSCGYNSEYRQIKKRMTWKPSDGMTKKQIEKELNRQAILFEEKCITGQFLDGNITLAEFSERWFKDYAEKQLKETSIKGYQDLMPRIIQALGHIKLSRLQPHHLMEFYNNLGEKGIRQDIKYKPCTDFKAILTAAGYTQKTLSEAANVGITTIRACYKGQNVSKKTADKITAALGKKNLFTPVGYDSKLSDQTIAKYHRLLSSMLTAAVQWQIILSNPCQRVKPPHVEYKEAAVLDEEQTAELIKCLQSEPLKYKTAVMLILYTGLRRGELCGLDWADIDIENGIVHVEKAVLYTKRKGIYEDTTKTKQSRRAVYIPKEMTLLLKEWKIEQCKQKLSIGDQWQESGKVFTSNDGSVMRPDTFAAWFKQFIRQNKLPDIHLHTLRHTSATLLIANGVNIATVSGRLGHANKTTTLNIYSHAIQSADIMAAEKLKDILTVKKDYKAM